MSRLVSLSVSLGAALTCLATAGPPVKNVARSIYFFQQGEIAYQAGRWKDAGRAFAQAGNAGYDRGAIHFWLGKVYRSHGQKSRAATHFVKAAGRGHRPEEAWLHVAELRYDLGEYDGSRAALAKLPPSAARRPRFLLVRGLLATEGLEFDAAYRDLREVVEQYPYRVHSASGDFPAPRRDELAQLAQASIQDLEAAALAKFEAEAPPAPAAKAAPVAATAAQPAAPRKPTGFAFRKKEFSTATTKLKRFGDSKGGQAGGTVLKQKKYGGATMN